MLTGKWLLAIVVLCSALALGSLPGEVLVVMTVLAAVANTLLWMDPLERIPKAARLVLVAMTILVIASLLQIIPLPAAVVRAIAPTNANIWERALSPLREDGPAWHPLSVAPTATLLEVVRGAFYACIFLGGLRIAALEKGERFLERTVIISTTVFALCALAHAATGAEKVFGVYRPRDAWAYNVGRLAPLLNTNHLAAYLNIGACVSISAFVARRTLPRAITASTTLLLAITSVWVGSRGGMGALVFGVLLSIALTLYIRRRFQSDRAEAAIVAVCVLASALMIAIATSESTRRELADHGTGKIAVAKNAFELVARAPWLGFGRGAFETVFPLVRRGVGYPTFTHPENIAAQWSIEWGVPIAIVAFLLFAIALRPKTLLRSSRPSAGAWAAIVSAVVSDLVDFHLEVPGVVALLCLCVAMVVGGRARSRAVEHGTPRLAVRHGAFAFGGLAIVAALFALPGVAHSLAAERRILSAMAIDPETTKEAFHSTVRASMMRYPGESFTPLMGGVRALLKGDESVIPWVARSLECNPRFGRAHFVLARSLGPRHAAQSRLEYRLAYEYDYEELADAIVADGSRLVEDADTAMELVPFGEIGTRFLELLVPAIATRLPATADALDREILRRSPTSRTALLRRVEAALSDVTNAHPWCDDRDRCLRDALATATELTRAEPAKCASHLLEAKIRIERGEQKDALDALESAIETMNDRSLCQQQLIVLAQTTGDKRRADATLDRLMRGGCGTLAECVELYTWAAGHEEARGNPARAVALYRRVVDIAPEREDIVLRLAALAARLGLNGEAIKAYEIMASRHPEDGQWRKHADELKAKSIERAMGPSLAPRP